MKYIQGTFAVAAGVLALSLVIAVVSAWLAANFSFCYVEIIGYGRYFHQIFGFRLEFMDIYGAIFMLSLSLYPYILYTC